MTMKTFRDTETKGDVTKLFKEIRASSLEIETNTSVYDTLDEIKTLFYVYSQEEHEGNARHLNNFKRIVEDIEHLGGKNFSDRNLVEYEKKVEKE